MFLFIPLLLLVVTLTSILFWYGCRDLDADIHQGQGTHQFPLFFLNMYVIVYLHYVFYEL